MLGLPFCTRVFLFFTFCCPIKEEEDKQRSENGTKRRPGRGSDLSSYYQAGIFYYFFFSDADVFARYRCLICQFMNIHLLI